MKLFSFFFLFLLMGTFVNAQIQIIRPYEDIYGHSYSNSDNLSKDKDKDGYSGMYDYNDNNRKVTTAPVPSFSVPSFSSPTLSTPSIGQTIYTGPRGGKYTINSNGNKSYIKNDDPW